MPCTRLFQLSSVVFNCPVSSTTWASSCGRRSFWPGNRLQVVAEYPYHIAILPTHLAAIALGTPSRVNCCPDFQGTDDAVAVVGGAAAHIGTQRRR